MATFLEEAKRRTKRPLAQGLSFEDFAILNPTNQGIDPRFRYTAPPVPETGQVAGAFTRGPGAAVQPAAQRAPDAVPDPVAEYYSSLPTELAPEDTQAQVRERARRDMQSYIDSINAVYSDLIRRAETVNQDLSGQTRARAARSGTLGSDFGAAAQAKTEEANAQRIAAIENQRNLEIQNVYREIDVRAQEEYRAKKAEIVGNIEKLESYRARRGQNQEKAKGDFLGLAKAGVDLNVLDPARVQSLIAQSGFDSDLAMLVYNANKPKAEQIDYQYKIENGKLFAFGVDPATGKLKTHTVDTGIPDLPPNYKPQFAPDGTLMLFPDKFDPNLPPKGQIQVIGNFAKPERDTKKEEDFSFTETQIAIGAAAAGMTIAEFRSLPIDQQNEFIYGAGSELEGGRLSKSELDDRKKLIDEAFASRTGVSQLREQIDNSNVPQEDKEELKKYVEENAPKPGFFSRIFKR